MMAQAHRNEAGGQPQRRRRTALRTAVIAALLHKPGHGYDIADRLDKRMGPGWEVPRKRIYDTLVALAQDGLAWSEDERAPGQGAQMKRVFHPTPLAEQERLMEMAARRPVLRTRGDIRAWVAFARPQDAPGLLRKLDEYEVDCLALIERLEELEDPASWYDRGINLMRLGTTEELNGELRWIPRARREVADHLAQ